MGEHHEARGPVEPIACVSPPSWGPTGIVGAVVALLLLGCGGEQGEPADQQTATAPGTGADATARTVPRPGGNETGADGRGAGTDAEGGSGSSATCEYSAPPGRLGDRGVSLVLAGTSCDQGRRLALAAALGQPAGANIPVRRDGFRCDPSTRERGVEVTYSCTRGSESAEFTIAWMSPGTGP